MRDVGKSHCATEPPEHQLIAGGGSLRSATCGVLSAAHGEHRPDAARLVRNNGAGAALPRTCSRQRIKAIGRVIGKRRERARDAGAHA